MMRTPPATIFEAVTAWREETDFLEKEVLRSIISDMATDALVAADVEAWAHGMEAVGRR